MKKKIIFAAVAIIVLALIVNKVFFKKEELSYVPENVVRGTIVQEVSEDGTVERGEEINLNFKSGGKIEQIYVGEGDAVKSGDKLAKLETTQLSLQLTQAEATVVAQKARLSELREGADTDLEGYYNNTPTILNQAYNLAEYAIRQQISSMFLYRTEMVSPYYELTYNNCNEQASADSESQRKVIENDLSAWRAELQNLGKSNNEYDAAITESQNHLATYQNFLNRLNDTLNTDCKLTITETANINTYKPIVSAAITSLNTAASSVLTQKKTIDAQKIVVQNYDNKNNQQEINYQEALVEQAEAAASLLRSQIVDAVLKSPSDGQITQIKKEKGEIVQAMESFMVFIPQSPFEINTNIYEEDIVKVKIGDSTKIELTAFPDQIFEGKVVSIDPAATLVGGVVYFGVTIDIQDHPAETRPGMSADIVIKTAQKDGALIINSSAIEKKDGKVFVKVVKEGGILEEREIKIGLKGEDGKDEVVFGLKEGEIIAIEK